MLTIHIIRTSQKKDDDIITIRENTSMDFFVTYTDRQSSVRYSFICSGERVLDYLWSVFDFLRIDEEPFEQVQIVSPVHPSIMLGIKTLTRDKVRTVIRTLRAVLQNWPHSFTPFSHMHECV